MRRGRLGRAGGRRGRSRHPSQAARAGGWDRATNAGTRMVVHGPGTLARVHGAEDKLRVARSHQPMSPPLPPYLASRLRSRSSCVLMRASGAALSPVTSDMAGTSTSPCGRASRMGGMRNAPGGVSRADDGFDETPTVNSPGALHREPPGVVARRRAPLGVPVCEEELNSPCTSIAETRDANLELSETQEEEREERCADRLKNSGLTALRLAAISTGLMCKSNQSSTAVTKAVCHELHGSSAPEAASAADFRLALARQPTTSASESASARSSKPRRRARLSHGATSPPACAGRPDSTTETASRPMADTFANSSNAAAEL
mmetsp:Transcript_20867/g.63824  ORF Transcript_20867/g.63824 Transcript_20867/m.63824 type:complete len:319 (+) Transcript_20867:438-1394(+)